jgi:hypothetical protein
MQRHEMMAAMAELGLKGMAGAFDEAVTAGLQRKRTMMEILTDLLRAETTHRHAASVRYRMSAAKLPAVKDLDAFVFDGTPITKAWCARCTAAPSRSASATSCSSVVRAPARRTSPALLPPTSFETAPAGATSTRSTW